MKPYPATITYWRSHNGHDNLGVNDTSLSRCGEETTKWGGRFLLGSLYRTFNSLVFVASVYGHGVHSSLDVYYRLTTSNIPLSSSCAFVGKTADSKVP